MKKKKKEPFKLIIHNSGKTDYILISELPEEQREPFDKWMRGQTCPVIEGVDTNDAVYPWDYQRWKDHRAGYFVPFD